MHVLHANWVSHPHVMQRVGRAICPVPYRRPPMRGTARQPWETAPPAGPPHRTGRQPERCAGTCAIQAGVTAAVGVAALAITMIRSAGADGQMRASALPVAVGVGVLVVVAIVWAVRRWGAAMTSELLAGYTTSTPTAGAWWLPPRRSDRPVAWVHWDYTGIEVRRRDGTVRQPTTPTVPAPGFYPSPHEPGRLELWTGSQWTGHHLRQ